MMRPMVPAGSSPPCSAGEGCSSGGPPTGYFPPISSPEILPAPIPVPLPAPVPAPAPGGGGGSCGLRDECCNMAEAGCCVGGEQQQQCYTVWETKCRSGGEGREGGRESGGEGREGGRESGIEGREE